MGFIYYDVDKVVFVRIVISIGRTCSLKSSLLSIKLAFLLIFFDEDPGTSVRDKFCRKQSVAHL